MDHSNATLFFTDSALVVTAITGTLNAWCIVGNIVIIVIICKTPGMRGFSGAFIVNHAVAEVIQECVTQCAVFVYVVRLGLVQLDIHLRLCMFALSGVISHSLSAVSANLYLAICKQQRYSRMVTWRRVFAFLGLSWTFNITLSALYYVVPSFYTVDYSAPTDVVNMNITPSNCWLLVLLVLNIVCVPFCTATTCFLKIRSIVKHPSIATIGPINAKKVQLSQMGHVFTIIYLLTYVPVFIVASTKVQIKGLRTVLWAINISYYVIKPFLYLKLYKPFRETAKVIFLKSCLNSVGPPHQVTSVQTAGIAVGTSSC